MKKNILLLIADDLGRLLGCYGDSSAKTPHIDALASDGVRFDNAFTSTASCSGSRSVIYTGLHTHENGMYGLHHDHHHFMTFDNIETAPELFNNLGYFTGIIGKVHVGPEAVYPWSHRQESGTRDVNWVASEAEQFFDMANNKDQPFFLTIGFVDPHRDMTRSGFGNETQCDGLNQADISLESVNIPGFLPDLPEVREELVEYHRSVQRLDYGVGLVLKALEKAGYADDTLVIFLSDNGAPFLNSKTTLYDAGIRLPFIVRSPGGNGGVVNPSLISYIDILPTLIDWADSSHTGSGNEVTAKEESIRRRGRSFLSVLTNEGMHVDWQIVFGSHTFHEITNYYPTRFIRTPRYKYHRNIAWQLGFPFSGDIYGSLSWQGIRNRQPVMLGERTLESYVKRPAEELYDLESDPKEVNNLALDPAYAEVVQDMRIQMERWQNETDDTWLYRDGISVRAIQHHIDAGMKVPERFDFDINEPGNEA